MQSTQIEVRFFDEALKNKYKRDEAEAHSWNAKSYLVLAIESDPPPTDKGWVVLCNSIGEIWWVLNQHIRIVNIEDFCDG